jgi:hypothetical protein
MHPAIPRLGLVLIEVVDRGQAKLKRAVLPVVYFIAFCEQQFSQISPLPSRKSCNKRAFHE